MYVRHRFRKRGYVPHVLHTKYTFFSVLPSILKILKTVYSVRRYRHKSNTMLQRHGLYVLLLTECFESIDAGLESFARTK